MTPQTPESDHVDRVFLWEIDRQARYALLAAGELGEHLRSRSVDGVFRAIQSILIAAGNVSKLLWPERNPERGKRLRTRARGHR